MEIVYYGHSCFQIKNKKINIVMDPYDHPDLKLKLPDLKADVVTVSHAHRDHNAVHKIQDNPRVLDWPGEYEVNEVSFTGISSFHDNENGATRGENVIFIIKTNGTTVCHLGDLGCKLTEAQIDQLGQIDVLLIPMGGKVSLDAKLAKEVVEQIEPRVVIPMHYKLPDTISELAPVDDFLKVMNLASQNLDSLNLEKISVPEDKTEIVVLKPQIS
ncbi:hypothetical protein COT40_01870 [Candidatus Peregrinibacteria bacterium CG08_land_8_20_14_0_20_41_10]|nr:MAG: hypothetical protein AUJ78_01900 [Candidatus Peregrinibacteria bacterium CG1_02_41_10]PIS32093.1 MAG: hypothetical protein COT40_01870 [Candidatus Peregrinibacteria bacterium CG08_land_8_20_14_0_20_41_10]